MPALQSPAAFFVGLLLFSLSLALRRSAAARRLITGSRELVDELRGPQVALALFLLASAVLTFFAGSFEEPQRRTLGIAVDVFAVLALAHSLDTLVFGTARALGRRGPPRIIRSLLLWVVTFVACAAGARAAWKIELSSLLTTSALLSVVLGFALQESFGNLFAGITLNAEHPFEPGDWVTFGSFTGRVLDVGWRSTRLVTQDDDELLVPNGFISREVVVNHSRPSMRRSVELLVTLDLDASPVDVRAVLLKAARESPGVLQEPAPQVQLARFVDDGVLWRLRFYTPDFAINSELLDRVQEALWFGLRRAGIDLPYKQLVLQKRERSGEAEARRSREHLAEVADLLSRIDFVAALKPEARAELAQQARFLEFGPGEAVVRQGDAGDSFYLVARGELGVRIAAQGSEQEVARLGRGAFFGEGSLLTGEPRTATVVSLGHAALVAIDRGPFARIFAHDESVMEELARVIAGRKAQLASAVEAAGSAAHAGHAQTLLARIRGIFGKKI